MCHHSSIMIVLLIFQSKYVYEDPSSKGFPGSCVNSGHCIGGRSAAPPDQKLTTEAVRIFPQRKLKVTVGSKRLKFP